MTKKTTLLLLLLSIGFTAFAQTTSIPDVAFEQFLISQGIDSGEANGVVDTANISGITTLEIAYEGIVNFTGIEDFTALTELSIYAGTETITIFDVSNNLLLTKLTVRGNLTTLDVSNNTALVELDASGNALTTLDVSNNTALVELEASSSALTTLDVSNNTALEELDVTDNQLTALDVSNNTALIELYCYDNQLTTLDVSSNTALEYLTCENNQLTALDLSNNSVLTDLYCYENQLITLDVSGATALEYVDFEINPLETVNLQNGNNENMEIYGSGTPNLTCIQVDNAQFSTDNWSGDVDAGVTFSENCPASGPTTSIPDANFEQALIDLNIDTDGVINGQAATADLELITTLNVNNKNISDLTGIEDFPLLEELLCGGNLLTTLDVSENIALTSLVCFSNELTELNLSANIALTALECSYNQLTALDLSNNTALIELYCYDNQLTTLDVSNNTALEYLSCENNQLTGLDLSNNTALTELYCYDNQLITLDVSSNTALEYVDFEINPLEAVNLQNGNNENMEIYGFETPNLTCIQVDNAQFSIDNWSSYVDAGVTFSENCASLSVEYDMLETMAFYPNPATTNLTIKSKEQSTYVIIDITGKTLMSGALNIGANNLNISKLNSGMLFVKINNNNGSFVKKIIKN